MNRFVLTAVCFVLLIFSATVCFSKATEVPVNTTAVPSTQNTRLCAPEALSDDMQNSVAAGLNA